MAECKYLKKHDVDKTLTIICENPYLNEHNKNKSVLCFDSSTCPKFEPVDSKYIDNKSNSNVNHPNHYCQGGIECIKAIEASMLPDGFQDYCKGNVLKYIWRWRDKAGVEDLKKARVYLNWMIESAEKEKTE